MKDFFNLMRLQIVLITDSWENTLAMTTPVETLSEIFGAFSNVAYHKAGSVLRMFQNAVGEEMFRDALRIYLKENRYEAVSPEALYNAFKTIFAQENFTDFKFKESFQSWENQRGYPLVHVSYDELNNEFQITQKVYMLNDEGKSSSWWIPLNFATSKKPDFDDTKITHYMNFGETYKTIKVDNFANGDWFVFNKQQLSYYRVNYDSENWQLLIEVLNSENYNQIHVLNRAQLVNDALNLAENGILNMKIAMKVLSYLKYETDYVPWSSSFISLYTFDDTFGGSSLIFNRFMRILSTEFYDRFVVIDNFIPFNEPLMDKFGREFAISWSCRFGNEKCLKDMNNLLKKELSSDFSVIPRGFESLVFCNGLRGTNKTTEWNQIFTRMQTSQNVAERLLFIDSLGCSEDEKLLKDYLESSIASSDVNYIQSERLRVFNSILANSVGIKAIVDFLTRYEAEVSDM
jgi:aminopeptidase N